MNKLEILLPENWPALRRRLAEVEPPPVALDQEAWGMPYSWQEESPGVYFIRAYRWRAWIEELAYYAIPLPYRGGVLSARVFATGTPHKGVCYFEDEAGGRAVRYELLAAQAGRAGGWKLDCLRDNMLYEKTFGAERCPEYFGAWVPPSATPWGAVEQVRTVQPGVWFVRVERGWYLAVVYPYHSMLGNDAAGLGREGEGPYPLRFWPAQACAPAVHELVNLDVCGELARFLPPPEEFKAYLGAHFPEYVRRTREQLEHRIEAYMRRTEK
ncbi:hypothetical protein CE91St41_21350 [Oscillospiraceae bacterium]|nr:hypothetical protein CE91St40_16180 [Oscillospiraceae bacterium]BDF75246.1 hypothetical protein CE91St41_21350 [Oscillospiraceae bacterium]